MNKEKIMELLKNKKVQLIGILALCGFIAIGMAFFMINDTKDSTKIDKSVAVENKSEDNKESKKVSEEEAKKELEELKKADTSKLSDEEKKQTEEKIKSIETMIENKEYEKAQQEVENVKNNVASKVKTTINKVEEKKEETTTKVDENKTETNQEEVATTKSIESTKAETPVTKVEEKKEAPKVEKKDIPVVTHTHNWVDVTEEIVHAEEGHWEEFVVTPEQVNEVPVYGVKTVGICNGCGADITADPWGHLEEQMLAGDMACSGYTVEDREVQTGTKQEVTPAVTEKKWVVDKAPWTETKVVGQKCSGCGATE